MDIWDPNNWDLTPKVCRLYLDDSAQEFALLNQEDYWWAVKWRWHINRPHKNRRGTKRYVVRSQGGAETTCQNCISTCS